MDDQVLEHGDCTPVPAAAAVTVFPGSAAGAAGAAQGRLLGIFCSTSSSGTILVQDGQGNTLIPQFNATAATYYKLPATAVNGLVITFGGTFTGAIFSKGA